MILSTILMSVLAKHIDFDHIVKTVNGANAGWTAGHHKRWQTMDWLSIASLMGTLPTPEHMKFPALEIVAGPQADSFDPRQQWPGCQSLKEVRDQSNCGSCWAFGAVEAMSDRICVASNQTDQTRISSEDLLSCCGVTCGNGCNGGYPEGAWSYFKSKGLSTGDLYGDKKWCKAYSLPPCDHHVNGTHPACKGDSRTPSCTRQCETASGRSYSSDMHHGKSVYSVRGEANVMHELSTNGPIEASFTVYEDFLAYKTGVYKHVTGSALGGHAVKLMGWGTEDGTPYWLLANSWNEDWGDKGFFKIRRGTNECGIEGGLVAGLIA